MPECPCLWTVTYRRRYLGEDNHTRYDYDDSEYYYSEDRATQRKQEMDLSAWLREPRHDAFRLLDDICREGSGFTGEDVGILKGVHERYGHRSSADSTRMGQGGRYRRILAEIDTVAIRTIMLLLSHLGSGGHVNCIILTDEALRDFLVTNAAHITEDMLVETLALARSEEAA